MNTDKLSRLIQRVSSFCYLIEQLQPLLDCTQAAILYSI